jgi:hypothetical protein
MRVGIMQSDVSLLLILLACYRFAEKHFLPLLYVC